MKIVSPFKDYYDGYVQYGIDEDLKYFRKSHEDTVDLTEGYARLTNLINPLRYLTTQMDHIYPRRAVDKFKKVKSLSSLGIHVCMFLYVVGNQMRPLFDVIFVPHGDYEAKYHKYSNSVDGLSYMMSREGKDVNLAFEFFLGEAVHLIGSKKRFQSIENYVNKVKEDSSLELVREFFSHPIVRMTDSGRYSFYYETNPRLDTKGVTKIWDGWEVYQLLLQYLANQKNPEKDMIEIEDKYKIVESGFDDWSFRKKSGEKGQNWDR